MSEPYTNQDLIKEAYATNEHLLVRSRTHELYTHPQRDFKRWVIESVEWRGDERVLDVGAGAGEYASLVQEHAPDGIYVAGDLSLGMLRQARNAGHPGDCVNLDAQNLPFDDGLFDYVLANHMLYHVPDIDQALSEIRRVLKPGGCLVAATNSQETMQELDTLSRRACTLLGHPRHEFRPMHVKFSLENGPIRIAHYFRAVARHDLPSALHFPEVEPVLAYLNSTRTLRAGQLPEDVTWEQFMGVMQKQLTRLIRHYGELQVRKLAGVIIATNHGGFAADYLQKLDAGV